MKKVNTDTVLLKINNLERRLHETKKCLNNLEFKKRVIESDMHGLSFGIDLLGEMIDLEKPLVTLSSEDTETLSIKIATFSDEIDSYKSQIKSTQVTIDSEKILEERLMFAIQILKELVHEEYDAVYGSDLL